MCWLEGYLVDMWDFFICVCVALFVCLCLCVHVLQTNAHSSPFTMRQRGSCDPVHCASRTLSGHNTGCLCCSDQYPMPKPKTPCSSSPHTFLCLNFIIIITLHMLDTCICLHIHNTYGLFGLHMVVYCGEMVSLPSVLVSEHDARQQGYRKIPPKLEVC